MYKGKRNYENLQKCIFEGVGEYGIPQILNGEFKQCDFISFNYAKSCKQKEEKGVHFFVDDYQFSRIWNNPDAYIDMLSDFACVLSPDFSTYTDFPKAIQIYNHYRKHWIGAYMQLYGANVIPTISWSDKNSFEWCFDGEPEGGTVAVSSVRCMNSKEKTEMFVHGYKEMIIRLQPDTIIFYGSVPEQCMGNIVRVKPFSDKFKEVTINGW